jgi:hypothetical protein
MKKCSYCGRENPDEATHCSGCATGAARQARFIETGGTRSPALSALISVNQRLLAVSAFVHFGATRKNLCALCDNSVPRVWCISWFINPCKSVSTRRARARRGRSVIELNRFGSNYFAPGLMSP